MYVLNILMLSMLAQQPIGEYLGQELPGEQPKVFAPHWVSTGLHERGVSFSPDGKSCYWDVILGSYTAILMSEQTATGWSKPQVASFSGVVADFEPVISYDGTQLFFVSSQQRPGKEKDPANIWVAGKKDGGWGKPTPLNDLVNGDKLEYFPSLTRDGTLYFGRIDMTTGKAELFRSRLVGESYGPAELLPQFTADAGLAVNACIAADESYILYPDKRQTDGGDADFFIRYRSANDQWGEPKPLNVPFRTWNFAEAARPSPDGAYLFLCYVETDTKGNLWDRPTRFPKSSPVTREALLDYHNGPRNGQLDVYWVSAKILPKPGS